jgi:pyruvate,water dikinase
MARTYLPLRGVGKVAFLQSLDVARAAARRLGGHLAAAGVLHEPEDVFFLTLDELAGGRPDAADALVAERRGTHAHYATLRIPALFRGDPEPEPVGDDEAVTALVLAGTGASPGIVEGRVVVVIDPATADVEPGDILVAHTTDPSWASLMFLSKALVVDIGGLLSHAAVVARELGIPCVMGTQYGTRSLRTGDLCRVDGGAGTVEVVERGGQW